MSHNLSSAAVVIGAFRVKADQAVLNMTWLQPQSGFSRDKVHKTYYMNWTAILGDHEG